MTKQFYKQLATKRKAVVDRQSKQLQALTRLCSALACLIPKPDQSDAALRSLRKAAWQCEAEGLNTRLPVSLQRVQKALPANYRGISKQEAVKRARMEVDCTDPDRRFKMINLSRSYLGKRAITVAPASGAWINYV